MKFAEDSEREEVETDTEGTNINKHKYDLVPVICFKNLFK